MQNKEVVLITGSSGFIGRKLADALRENYLVIGLDICEPQEPLPEVIHYDIDMTSKDRIIGVLGEIREKYGSHLVSVIHLVAFYDFNGEEDKRYKTITVNGTKYLLEELERNFQVEQFIFSSSLLVYKPGEIGEKINDESPLAPGWPYPQSKVEAEEVIQAVRKSIPVVNLRISGVYDDTCHSPTISQQIMRIYEGHFTSFLFPGDIRAGQTFLHLEDLKDVMVELIKKRQEFSGIETFVLGEEQVVSFKTLQEKIGHQLHNRPWPAIRIPKFMARTGAIVMERMPFIRKPFIRPWMVKHSDEHFDVDISKIKEKTRWAPKRSLEERISVMTDFLKKDPDTFYKINKIEKPFYRDLKMIGEEGEKNFFFASVSNIFLGLLLLSNPFSFGDVTGGEFISQVVSGLLVMIFASLSLIPTIRWTRWLNTGVGFWLLFSPLIFFTPSAAAYSNDTLLGGLIILISAYTPCRSKDMDAPPGWSYNPSTAGQRIPIMLLAFLGFILSRYMASYQLGHIDSIWDPLFGDGTKNVLTSSVSQAFPVSDAGLGALTYLLDVIAASIGGRDRWKSLPWAVILFGIMIIPSGVVSITLIMLQPISVGAWCTLCLLTALIMLLMVPPAVDEVLASIQFLKRRTDAGESFWKVFWLGSEVKEVIATPRVKPEGSLLFLYLSTLLSSWVMVTPWLFEMEGNALISTYVVSALLVTFSIIAMSEVARLVRLINVPLGLWLALSGWIMPGMNENAAWHSLIVGVLIMILNIPRGKREEAFGSMDKIIHWTPLKR